MIQVQYLGCNVNNTFVRHCALCVVNAMMTMKTVVQDTKEEVSVTHLKLFVQCKNAAESKAKLRHFQDKEYVGLITSNYIVVIVTSELTN